MVSISAFCLPAVFPIADQLSVFGYKKRPPGEGGWLVVGSGWNAVGSQLDIFIYNSIILCQVLAVKGVLKILYEEDRGLIPGLFFYHSGYRSDLM